MAMTLQGRRMLTGQGPEQRLLEQGALGQQGKLGKGLVLGLK